MTGRSGKGFALLAVLWIMTGVAVLGLVLSLTARSAVSTARNRQEERLWFITNWSAAEQRVGAMPVASADLFNEEVVGAGEGLDLGPWDVRVLVER